MNYNTKGFGRVNENVICQHMSKRLTRESEDVRRYHHGDLRRELLRVAREAVACHGAEAVSLSALARRAGVSQPASYRHFSDRTTLLEAVAAEAFEEFTRSLTEAVVGLKPADALKAMARAYVSFGEANIELYRLMFASRLTPEAKTGSDLDQVSGRAFGLLRSAMMAMSPALTDKSVYLAWSQLHGLVMLKAEGFIRSPLQTYVAEWCRRALAS